MPRVWFITGSSRGLGRSLTAAVLARGDRVAATARNPEHLKEPGGFRTEATSSMACAPEVEGYEKTVGKRIELFKSSNFIPMGDPGKAEKVMIGLVENPAPPVRLVLGSDAIGRIKQAGVERSEEMEKWLPVSNSTDADDAITT